MRNLSYLGRRIVVASSISLGLAAVASCGSRTGLFGPEDQDLLDATAIDVEQTDAIGRDATIDRGGDTRVDAPIDSPTPCLPGTFDFQLASAQIMFVLDRSGSMAFALGRDQVPTPPIPDRWNTLHDALGSAILPFDKQIAMGAKFFPEANADPFDPVGACITASGVGITPAIGNANAILNIFSTTQPKGGTPTASAITFAGQFLSGTRGIARTMVVATDGAPNCNGALNGDICTCTQVPNNCQGDPQGGYNCLDDVATVGAISDIFTKQKIPVYVVGIGGATFSATLDAMAVAGGRPSAGVPKYLPGDTGAEMQAAFTTVRDSVAKCTYLTPSSPTDPNAITVTVAGASVARDPTHTDGWDWIDQEFGELELFGSACNTATAANVNGTIECRDD